MSRGALYWSDFIFDDIGGGNGSSSYTYPAGAASGNGADIFRAAVGWNHGGSSTVWRVDWNTLVDPAVPLAVWTFDTDANASTGAN